MKFGVRECCEVVLRAKAAQKIGNKVFYKNEPVIYFDTLKTSSLEGAATTVYATGGRGNPRLIGWDGERTMTFTMEDALISPEGFSILSGAGLVQAEEKPVIMHTTERTNKVTVTEGTSVSIVLSKTPYVTGVVANTVEYKKATGTYNNNTTYYTRVRSGSVYTYTEVGTSSPDDFGKYYIKVDSSANANPSEDFIYVMLIDDNGNIASEPYIAAEVDPATNTITILANESTTASDDNLRINDISGFTTGCTVLVDYYVKHTSGAYQVDITPDKFGGNFYLEADTLFRAENGVDMPAQFVIPNCKVQSNFTFTMASTGDPSTFTFTMDAFPDYTRWDSTKKVYAALQVLEQSDTLTEFERLGTAHNNNSIKDVYNAEQKPYIEI